ncbi:MAG: UDP-N-acetylmuramate dehydrogenase [Maioricimonas sp. JB045]
MTEQFSEITRSDVPLAPYTWLNVGGPAQLFIEPRTRQELKDVISTCQQNEIPIRLLGGGSNLLVRDEGFGGAVIHLTGDEFTFVSIEGTTVRAGAAAPLSHVISQTVNAGLAGLETLVGISGTQGGAIRGNAGGRHGDIGQFVRAVDVVTSEGKEFTRTEDELAFDYRHSSINELVVVSAELALSTDDPDSLTRRMRKLWIMKKAAQPLSFQSAGCIFKNPRGLSAGALIEQAGLKGTRVGQCEVSDRHANFIVTHDGATSDDILKLIDLIRTQVSEIHGVQLELEIQVW